jgi:hypothetical protein
MRDREAQAFHDAYATMVAEAPAPPAWEQLEHGAPTALRPEPRRRRSLAVALAAAAAVLVLIGGAILAFRAFLGGTDEVADPTTPTTSIADPSVTTLPTTPTTTPETTATTLPAPPGTTIPVIGGDPEPAAGFADPRVRIVDAAGVAGSHVTMVRNADGYPVMAYVDTRSGEIRVATCSDALCVGPIEIATLTTQRFLEGFDLAVAPDGTPVVAVAEWSDEPESGATTTIRVVTPDSDVMVFGPTAPGTVLGFGLTEDGRPVIAAFGWIAGQGNTLTLLECADPTCEAGVGAQEVSTADGVFAEVFAYDPAGRPVWATSDGWLHRCEDSLCRSGVEDLGNTAIAFGVESAGAELAFTSAGAPVVATAHWAMEPVEGEPPAPLNIAVCNDSACREITTASISSAAQSVDLAVDAAGRPVVVWSEGIWDGGDARGPALFTARCLDAACTSWTSNPTGLAAGDADVLVADDGTLLVAYETGAELALVTCADGTCADAPTAPSFTSLDVGGWGYLALHVPSAEDRFPAVGLSEAGNPVILLEPDGDGLSTAVVCATPDCVDYRAVSIDENLGWSTATADLDANLVVFTVAAWSDDADGEESWWIRCLDPDCSDVVATPIEAGSWWNGGDVAIGPDGRPVGVHTDPSEPAAPVKLVRCADAECRELAGDPVVVDSTFGAWHVPQIAIGTDGHPVIAFWQWDELRLVDCHDAECSDRDATTISIDGSGEEGVRLRIAPDGRVALAFETGDHRIALATCSDPSCVDLSVVDLDRPFSSWLHDVGFGPDGFPVVSYTGNGDARLAACRDAGCSDVELFVVSGLPRLGLPADHPDDGMVAAVATISGDGTVTYVFLDDVVALDDDRVAGTLVAASCADCLR